MSKLKIGKNNPAYGKPAWNRNIPRTKETKVKQQKAMIGKYIGENSPNWKGGISFEKYPMEWTILLKESIRKRDHYTCQKCHTTDNKGSAFTVHHIDYNKKNCDPKNLITLCRSCNSKVNANRKYWTEYFNLLIHQICLKKVCQTPNL